MNRWVTREGAARSQAPRAGYYDDCRWSDEAEKLYLQVDLEAKLYVEKHFFLINKLNVRGCMDRDVNGNLSINWRGLMSPKYVRDHLRVYTALKKKEEILKKQNIEI